MKQFPLESVFILFCRYLESPPVWVSAWNSSGSQAAWIEATNPPCLQILRGSFIFPLTQPHSPRQTSSLSVSGGEHWFWVLSHKRVCPPVPLTSEPTSHLEQVPNCVLWRPVLRIYKIGSHLHLAQHTSPGQKQASALCWSSWVSIFTHNLPSQTFYSHHLKEHLRFFSIQGW